MGVIDKSTPLVIAYNIGATSRLRTGGASGCEALSPRTPIPTTTALPASTDQQLITISDYAVPMRVSSRACKARRL